MFLIEFDFIDVGECSRMFICNGVSVTQIRQKDFAFPAEADLYVWTRATGVVEDSGGLNS